MVLNVVPEGYMLVRLEFIEGIIADLNLVRGDQGKLGSVYGELVEGLKRGLKEVRCREDRQGKSWFTKILWILRKEML